MFIINNNIYLKITLKIIVILLLTLKICIAQNTINTSAKYALLIDHETGRILLNKNSNIKMSPASMSKLMTIYLTFEAIEQERINFHATPQLSPNIM